MPFTEDLTDKNISFNHSNNALSIDIVDKYHSLSYSLKHTKKTTQVALQGLDPGFPINLW